VDHLCILEGLKRYTGSIDEYNFSMGHVPTAFWSCKKASLVVLSPTFFKKQSPKGDFVSKQNRTCFPKLIIVCSIYEILSFALQICSILGTHKVSQVCYYPPFQNTVSERRLCIEMKSPLLKLSKSIK